ncbi:MAG: MmgE/PrpD family protein [Chloroflexi bacterium]|nr:MmgE/PrpD family protein [Chloroflexota bacterium]
MSAVTAELSAWVADLRLEDVPANVVEQGKTLLADITGIALLSRRESESTPALLAALHTLGLTNGRFRAIGDAAGYAATGAALLTGTTAHSIDFDDTHIQSLHHPSAPVIPAALVAAQMAGASGRDLLTGIIAGVEVMCRVGIALGTRSHYAKGFYATPTCGAFGATAAAGRILHLSAEQMQDAFGTVLSATSGSGQFHVNGAWTKRFQVGHAAANGVLAASLAQAGFTGAARALEGASGFYHLYSDAAHPQLTVAELGERWEILRIGFKPYPACRGMHAALDAAIALHDGGGLTVDDIDSVVIGLCQQSMDLVGCPEDRKRDPKNVLEGQFSAHFGIAVGLRLGHMGWHDYGTQLFDPEIRALMARTCVQHDAQVEAQFPAQVGGRVTVGTQSGKSLSSFVPIPKGEPENPLTLPDLKAKFNGLVEPHIGAEQAAELFGWILDLEQQLSISAYFDLTCRT